MIINLQEMIGGSPNEISRHLFEIYGHLVFSKVLTSLSTRTRNHSTRETEELNRKGKSRWKYDKE
jgi:uncharacterized membrane protein YagU involved in acid resistance